jgi:hypothetical protein
MPNDSVTTGDTLILLVHKCIRAFGFDIVRIRQKSAEVQITGSFPPRGEYLIVGKAENHFIHDGYEHRRQAIYYDDTENTKEWQQEVYRFAREVFDQKKLEAVCDIGCGSAYKLVKYFKGLHTIGLDVRQTCEWLTRKYPHLTWMELDFKAIPAIRPDLVIASDVIEHLLDPDELIRYILKRDPKYVVFSTPDRNLLRVGTHNGPPHNPAHIREWNFVEFEAYIASRFQILEHFISNRVQATQCLLCAPLRAECLT